MASKPPTLTTTTTRSTTDRGGTVGSMTTEIAVAGDLDLGAAILGVITLMTGQPVADES